MPQRPTIVVCLDGSSSEYVDAAVDGDAAPFLGSIVRAGRVRNVDAAMPTLTNPNNVSIVTGVPPSVHGISGNFFLSPDTHRAVMMNDATFLRVPTKSPRITACRRRPTRPDGRGSSFYKTYSINGSAPGLTRSSCRLPTHTSRNT